MLSRDTRHALTTTLKPDFQIMGPGRLSFDAVTEIPEHLLNRSKAAKAKVEGAEAPSAAPAGDTPAPVAAAPAAAKAAAPAAPATPAAKPEPPVVAAYKTRKKIPVWAMLTLSILPVWAFMYAKALTPEEAKAEGPLAAGATAYGQCSACHGGAGEGGVGYAFAGGEVVKTFPHIEDQLRFVYFGSQEYENAGIDIYGNPDREGGAHITKAQGVMPSGVTSFGLTDVDVLNVVCHERYTLGGLEHGEEYEIWCSETSEIHAALAGGTSTLTNLHETFTDIIPIGDVPVAGSPAEA